MTLIPILQTRQLKHRGIIYLAQHPSIHGRAVEYLHVYSQPLGYPASPSPCFLF